MGAGGERGARPGLRDSLMLRMGVLLGGIALFAAIGMGSSLTIAQAGRGDAAAINLAGSLRMQSYRIATQVAQVRAGVAPPARIDEAGAEFERRLGSSVLDRAAGEDARRDLLAQVRGHWQSVIRPLLPVAATAGGARGDGFLERVDAYVADIDRLVTALERGAEAKLVWLRWLQALALGACAILAVLAWRQVHRCVLPPLRDLLALAQRVRGGDFSRRAAHTGADELGVLGQAFNAMAGDLAKLYADLETRVREQTRALRQSNRSLQLLYDTARRLGAGPPAAATLRPLLGEAVRSTGAAAAALRLEPEAAAALDELDGRGGAAAPDCIAADPERPPRADAATLRIEVADQGRRYGVLEIERAADGAPGPEHQRLLETVAQHIAACLHARQRDLSQRRLALLEERNVIARELHDSLAQSLSYLKIQVSRLQSALPAGQPAQVTDILGELREGLGSAYRELRELLVTFRIAMPETGLETALARALAEFGSRGGLATELEFAPGAQALSPHQEIHVLQIVREALSNIVHHARARRARVSLERCGARIRVHIDDDGVGLGDNPGRERHYGLTIMRERARSLGGEIAFLNRDGGGCRVELGFPASAAAPSDGGSSP